ncbi:hypothetical protein RJ640_010996 [Escallonia rubra]|uniref:F-box domain-containing protein n=1 Tax=Escallonia rubra TaxID=112253 RepID=A0AA88RVY9_9ASTE|nr:hypothetical protein RJ640_010996 [Escallonia rubra]
MMNKEAAVPTSVDHLPSEIMFENMTMLPPKSLLSCNRVCQSWSTLIRSPGFIAAYHNRNRISNNTGYLMLEHITIGGKLERIFSRYDGSLEQRGEASSLPCDYFRGWGYKIVASTNELVCLIDKYAVGAIIFNTIYLWNLALNKLNRVSRSGIGTVVDGTGLLGLGYCPRSNDFKVVNGCANFLVKVYTLSTNSWRTVATVVPCVRRVDPY